MMKINNINSTGIYILIVALMIVWCSYDAFNGIAFWQGAEVQRNAGYNGPVAHSGYGVRFYHK